MPSIDTWRVESRKSSGKSIYPMEADTLSTEKKLSRCSQRQILLACAISQTVRQTDPVFDRFAYIETSSTKSVYPRSSLPGLCIYKYKVVLTVNMPVAFV